MRVALLLNRRHVKVDAATRGWMGREYTLLSPRSRNGILPEYGSFGLLGDVPPLVFGTGDPIPFAELGECDALIWEWSPATAAAQAVLDIHRRCPIRTIAVPGPVDRFWAELDWTALPLHREAARATSVVGVRSRDMIGFYKALLPWAEVVHLPVPVDLPYFDARAPRDVERNPDLVLLTAPTAFTGRGTTLPVSTLAAFMHLRAQRPSCLGLCFAYSAEEAETAARVVAAFGLADAITVERFKRPLHRYLTRIAECGAGIFLPRADIQGRTALIAAATGLPMVVSDDVETHRTLFPHSSVRWSDAQGAGDLAQWLLSDPSFRARVMSSAAAALPYFGVDACRARLSAVAVAPLAISTPA